MKDYVPLFKIQGNQDFTERHTGYNISKQIQYFNVELVENPLASNCWKVQLNMFTFVSNACFYLLYKTHI